jgi:hypothetical protein
MRGFRVMRVMVCADVADVVDVDLFVEDSTEVNSFDWIHNAFGLVRTVIIEWGGSITGRGTRGCEGVRGLAIAHVWNSERVLTRSQLSVRCNNKPAYQSTDYEPRVGDQRWAYRW